MFRFFSLLALVVAVIRLYAVGLLSQPYVLLALLAGVVIITLGPRQRIAAMAIAGLVFLAREYGGGAASALIANILALVLVLWAIQWMVRGVFRTNR